MLITRHIFRSPTRFRSAELAWLRVHVDMHETQTRERVAFTYLNLVTTFLSVIGAATALTHIIVGPGDYDPTGLLNKLFYYDVPVLKEAATDLAAEARIDTLGGGGGARKKSEGAEAGGADEAAAPAH
jgi:hypothetical protein